MREDLSADWVVNNFKYLRCSQEHYIVERWTMKHEAPGSFRSRLWHSKPILISNI
jgi:hypothetical protein